MRLRSKGRYTDTGEEDMRAAGMKIKDSIDTTTWR